MLSVRTINLLHVEDDVMQQRVIAHHLKAISEFAFVSTTVPSEELAMKSFQNVQFDLVLLDYQLVQGDGLHLLCRIRKIDPIIPVIAISGTATSEVAAQLVQAGADDYFEKRGLNSNALAKSIRSSLRRAEAVRKQVASRTTDKGSRFTTPLAELCAHFVRRIGADFLDQLDVMARDLKEARISASELQQLQENATARLEMPIGLDQGRRALLARPVLLELLVRIFDDPNPGA